MKNKKDLITDILQYLKDNEDARDIFKKCYEDRIMRPYNFNNLLISQKKAVLITALSSPNGKPICGFLDIENNERYNNLKNLISKCKEWGHNAELFEGAIMNEPRTFSETLLNTFIEHISNGEWFEDSYKKLNEKYNEIRKR